MSFYRITPDDLEFFTIVANPKRTFISSSLGVTGSVRLFSRQTTIEKEVQALSNFDNNAFDDVNLDGLLRQAKHEARLNDDNFTAMSQYMTTVNNKQLSGRLQKELQIYRTVPSTTFTKNSLKKTTIKKHLMPFYRPVIPSAHWAYNNYHSINFFTASGIPSNTAIIYPNSASQISSVASGAYSLPGAFTFDFFINPRYTTDDNVTSFRAGTIFHLSSSYAVSLVSGSNKDSLGRPSSFRLLLQLSHSADVSPSSAQFGGYPNNLIFLSNDVLLFNHWHHVAIRWGTNSIDNGTGSFIIDGVEKGTFVIPSSTINPAAFAGGNGNPDALVLGNYFQGRNILSGSQSVYFDNNVSVRDGLIRLNTVSQNGEPSGSILNHPLNAEVHDLKIYNSFRHIEEIRSSSLSGPTTLNDLVFYLGPFFTKESPFRTVSSNIGGVLKTPYFAENGTTETPFEVGMSFAVNGHYLNLENFGRDLVTGFYPRWYNLTSSQINDTAQANRTANDVLYLTGSVRKRNLTILPCDNGIFLPNYNLLSSGTVQQKPSEGSILDKFVNDLGNLDLGLISLNNLVSTSSFFDSTTTESGSIFENLAGATPENIDVDPGPILAILQRTRDLSSNEIVMFEISNIFYGNRINPKTFKIVDADVSGSGGRVSITIKDDGYGNLYRADSLTANATWNSIGNVFYNEGSVVIKTPNIPFFGKDMWEMEFEGEQTVHVLRVLAESAANSVNSSSNPNFRLVSSSLDANTSDSQFVYISNIYYLDDNLNVIMKSNLNQPVKKRNGDKLLIVNKMDF